MNKSINMTGFMSLVYLIGFLSYETHLNQKETDRRQSKNQDIVNEIYRVSAGSDKVIDSEERLTLVRELGITKYVDNNEILILNAYPNYIEAHLGAGFVDNGKYSHYEDRVSKKITPEKALEYLKKH